VSILLWAILAYLLYQFIFKLVIPVYTASRQIKKGFRDMQDRMHQSQEPRQSGQSSELKTSGSKPRVGEYIDFEEVK
jgi:hypothetical protein